MTEEFDDFEKRLRAALHAAADDIPISHDALERIRARTERRSLFPWTGLAWFRPVVAVGAAVLIAGSVLLGTPQLRNQVLPGSFVSASDTQRAEETPSQSPQAPADPEGVVPPPVHGAPSTLPSAAPEASPSAPEAEAPPTVFGSSACASPSPGERADSGAAEIQKGNAVHGHVSVVVYGQREGKTVRAHGVVIPFLDPEPSGGDPQ